jgi:hypothetical protein
LNLPDYRISTFSRLKFRIRRPEALRGGGTIAFH